MAELWSTVQEWLVLNVTELAINLVMFIIILAIGKIVIGGVVTAATASLRRVENMSQMLIDFLTNILDKALWIIVLMIGLREFGVDMAPLIAGLGVTGFIIGFACQESLSNVAAGFMIALNQPFRDGDWVQAGGCEGTVTSMNMMAVTITTADNKRITVPNSTIWGGAITNFTANDTRRVDLVAGIAYGEDIGKAKQVLLELVKKSDKVLAEPEPMIEVVELADSSVNLVVRPWVKTADYWTVFFATQRGIKDALTEAGIEIPFPQMDVHHIGPLPEATKN